MAKDMPSEQKAAVSVPSKPSGSSGSAQKPNAISQKSGTSAPQKPTSSGLRKPNFNPANMKKSTTGFHLTPELRAESMAMRRAHSVDVYNKNADRFATINDYINSGNLSVEQTKSFLEEAEGHAQSDYARAKVLTGFDESTGAPIHSDRAWSDEWTDLANLLRDAGMKASYQSEIEGLKTGIASRNTLRQAAQNRVRSATSLSTNLGGIDENGDLVEGDKNSQNASYWKNIIKGYDEQDALDNAKITALQNEMYEAFKTDEVRNAEAILNSADNDVYATDPSMLVSKEARDLAQMQIDNYSLELGLPTRYISEIDADRANVKSGVHGIEGALVGAAGTINKMAGQAEGEMNLGSETLVFNGTEWVQKTEEDGPKAQRRIGTELVPEAGEIAKQQAIANDTPFNPESDPIKAQTAKRAQEHLDSRAAVWTRNANNLQAQYDKNAERIAEIDKTDRSALDPQAVAELARERDRLKKENKALERDIKDARDIATQYGGGRGSISYYLRTGDREGFAGALDQVSWDLGDKAQEELRKAQEGRDIVTKTAMNMVKTGMEMGFDSVVGAATGVGGLPVMFVRVFGQASQEANRKGASLDRQVLYGLTVAGIEVLTEKIADFAGGAIYGKSFTGDLSKKLIHKLNASPNWETFLYAVADTLGEGAEEGLSDILAGFADMWIEYDKDKGFWQNWKDLGADDRANILYDVLLGSLMGAVGAGGAAVTGQYSADLIGQYQADIKRDFEAVDDAAEAKANAPRVSFAGSVAQASGPAGTAQTQAVQNALKGHFAEQLESETPKSAATKALEKVQAIREQIANGEEITVKLTRQEAAIAQSMGLLNKEAAKALREPTERQKAKANAIVEKSTGKTSERRETIIANATKEGVRTQSDTIPEGIRDESDADSLPPSPEGPQSSREAVAVDAAKAKEQKAAIDSGETNNKQLVDVVGEVDTYVGTQNPIATITKDEISDDSGLPLSKKVWNWIKKNFGDKVYSEKLKTDVIINERGIKNDVSHGVGKAKALTFQAVPAIIKNGEVVSRTIEDGKTKSIIVAGKVYLGQRGQTKPVNVYCLLKADDAGQNRFYLHEVSDGKGNLFYQLNNAEAQEESAASALQDSTPNNQGSAEEAPSGESIPQSLQDVNEGSTGAQPAGIIEKTEEGAVSELDQLRTENEGLRKQVEELQSSQPPADSRAWPSGVVSKSDNALRDKIQVKPSISNAEERAKDTAEKFGVSDGTYISLTREKVSQIAKYWLKKYGAKNEYNRLIEAKDWNRIDFSVAGKLVYDMTMKLNRDMTNGSRGLAPTLEWKAGETKEEYRARQKAADDAEYQRRRAEIDALIAAYGEQKSVAGQKLQEQYKYSVADEIRIKASKRFLSYSENGEVHNASEFAKNAKLWNVVDDLLTRMEAAETAGNANEMIELTKTVSRIRSRQNMFGKAGVAAENFMLDRMMKLGLDADKLATIAYGNINKIMDDITPISYADAIESVRMSNMLSNVATGINNLLNNAVSARTGALAQKAAIPFAKAFEKVTGRKIAIDDKSLFRTKEIRRAEELAYEYAVLSAYYGINSEDGRLDVRGTGGTFSVMDNGVGGFVERALARYNFFIQAFVLSPDAPVKARVKTGLQQGIEKAFEGADLTNPEVAANKHELEGYASHEAKRRTLQDDNRYTNAVLYVKKQLLGHGKTPGENVKIGGRELGSLDLGQFMIAFAKVPTNVGIQKVAATPYGSLYHVAKYATTLARAKIDPNSVSTMEMAKASRDVGRAATTWGSIGLGALAAMTGALKNFDDTDDDEEKKLAAEKGYRGLMLNLSTIFRPGDDWRDGDLILSANFLEILATPLSIGALIYDASQEGVTGLQAVKKGTMESFTGMIDAIMEIPGLQQAGELYQAFANRDPNEDDLNSALKALGQFSVNTGTSYFMPNIVSQFNAGLDNKQRDVYGADSYERTLLNIVMAKTPGLRQLLTEKTDAFGNSRTYADSKFMSVINTVLLPGDIKRYHVSDLEKELMRIKKETGYAGTFVDTKGPRKIEVGEDEYALNADQRRAFHETKAKHIVAAYDAFRNSEVYKSLTDEQRLAVYKALRMDAERMTKSEALKAAGIEATITMDKWETTLTSWENKATYQAIKQMFTGALDEDTGDIGDFAKMDELIKTQYPKLTKEMQELIASSNSLSFVDDVYGASKVGITSEKWQLAHNIYSQWTAKDENGKSINKANLANQVTMWDEIRRAGSFSDKQMDYIEENMKMYYFGSPKADQYYEYQDAGLSREAATRMIQATSGLEVQPGYTDYIQANQRYVAIAKTAKDAPEAWKAFWAIVPSNASKSKVGKLHKLEASGSDLMSALRSVGYSEIRGRKPNGKGGWTYYTISK